MYIAPNSTVQLMTNIPLEASYNHTLYWLSTAQMETYMSAHVLKTYQAQSYVHKNRGVLRLEGDMGVYAEVNYMRFKNTSFENKWFYAFVTDINYVNNEVFEVTFQIDVMQTWFFEYNGKLNQCMVEREHSASDNVGDNIVEENLELGPYVCSGMESFLSGNTDSGMLVVASQGPDGSQNSALYNGVYGGLYLAMCYDAESLEALFEEYKNGVTANLDPIISINQFPRSLFGWTPNHQVALPRVTTYTLTKDQTVGLGGFQTIRPQTGTVVTYVPRNNKLYTYPYNFMVFESPDGSSEELRYEFFKSHNVHSFAQYCAAFPSVEVMAYPVNYESETPSNGASVPTSYAGACRNVLTAKNYPTGGIASDAYSAWWAQNKNTLATDQEIAKTEKLIGATAGAVGNLLGGDVGGAAGELVKGIGNAALSDYFYDQRIAAAQADHSAVPDTVVSKASAATAMFATGLYDFKVYYVKIHYDYAKRIDAYFDRYGYAVKEVKTPVYDNRPVWNFIKTNGCTLNRTANVPAAFEREVCACFDRGITFWKNAGQVGQYTADNSPQ